jgi:prevent-host-death family protein
MREIGSLEAKQKLRALLDEVAHGAEIVITRRGKPVAKLIPVEFGFDRKKAKRAAACLREASKGVKLRGLRIKDLIKEGRGTVPPGNPPVRLSKSRGIVNRPITGAFHSSKWEV